MIVHLAKDSDPAQLGNDLLDFLAEGDDDCVAFVLKVRPVKFWVKAKVIAHGMQCTIKVRFYRDTAEGRYIIEFQRRNGDTIAFNSFFQSAAKFYTERGYQEVTVGSRGQPQQPEGLFFGHAPALDQQGFASLMPEDDDAEGPHMDPLLDLAGFEDFPNLRTEAGLAMAAAGKCPAAALAMLRHHQGLSTV